MKLHREGYKIVLLSTLLLGGILFGLSALGVPQWLMSVVGIALLVLYILIVRFFRNPPRYSDKTENGVVSPCDGKVVVIEEVEETEYFKDKRRQVSIFMSPTNVHVTRYAASGIITFSKYHPGKYLVAWHPKSSTENERTTIVIRTPKFGEILYRQIAGALARRIVNYAEEGESVQQGDDAGFIKFGSRVDLFLPLDCAVTVKLNQQVVGGKTCIASTVEKKDNEE